MCELREVSHVICIIFLKIVNFTDFNVKVCINVTLKVLPVVVDTYVCTVPLTLNLTHACVRTRACTCLTRVKVNNLACIVSAAHEFGVCTNARGRLDMHDTNMPATCTRFAI